MLLAVNVPYVTTADAAVAAAECPRVRAQAAAALVNFLEPCPAEIAALYLDSVLAACRQQVRVLLSYTATITAIVNTVCYN
jgi:hypothetical protein